ncbi:hypothetical protein SAMN05216413_0612 [Ruminococcaceae bacterium KH2T8]|nr:hypothetical protein SAMN05216413_0612 [Ruminococcaceae bacterium KH2T8]
MSNCERCAFYTYDDYAEGYVCDVDMDEDDLIRLSGRNFKECPYFQDGDEYKTVRHQM